MLVADVFDHRRRRLLIAGLACALAGCASATTPGGDDVPAGDDEGGDPIDAEPQTLDPDAADGPGSFTVGGTISGLTGTEMITLLNNGVDALTRGSGPFTFANPIASGSAYAVTVSTAPDHLCTVSNGTGTVTAAVSNVGVACVSRFLLRESFDALTAPNLPAGWVEAGPRSFDTQTGTVDTAPLSVFVSSVASVTDSTMTVPAFTMPATGTVSLTFRHNYALESGFDGGVLEVSIGGGAFTDLVTAGGTFLAGGYTAAISVNFSSPIGGRQAWTGSSGAYVSTTARMPASANGQTVSLRWRMATDSSATVTGWWIDTVAVRID